MDFNLIGDPAKARPMARYMKDQFPFVGVQTVARRAQTRPLLQAAKYESLSTVHAWLQALYARPEREYQYVAYDLAASAVRRFTLADLVALEPLVLAKPWWDTVDGWRAVYGRYLQLHPEDKDAVFARFDRHPDFWARRVAITLQLQEKGATDTAMLAQAIEYDRTTPEFFIQKAIGWALRAYSKTDAAWVRDFIATHELSKLAVREGSKYL
ncbi:DNA alkylation repair protein [Lacticaseibacillus daqingensis]|uniref:DNA alkylation repair protein n=1 Tax=Lacticaseibacillus daqingensis TaxID=2486014 RepID=UPI000F797392|nr:DNA alkylation repair protein [Lacticaseibacillus daqingensis]